MLTSGKHALNEVIDVTQDDAISLGIALALSSKSLDLNTLAYWDREFLLQSVWVVEDGTGGVSRCMNRRC